MPEQLLTDSEKDAIAAQPAPVVEEVKPPVVAAEAAGEKTEEVQGDEPEEKKKKGGWVRKIERLEAQLEESDRRYQEALDRLAGKTAGTETAPPVADGSKPKLENFKTYEEFNEALVDWKIAQRDAAKDQHQTATTLEGRYNQSVEITKAAHPDYDEVMNENADVVIDTNPQRVADIKQAIYEMDNGSEVVYHLAKNPEIVEDLKRMSIHRAIAELGRISASLDVSSAPAPKKTRSAAPAPITPVSGATATTPGDPSKMSPAEYRKWREQTREA